MHVSGQRTTITGTSRVPMEGSADNPGRCLKQDYDNAENERERG
jgi:hypothetical protein